MLFVHYNLFSEKGSKTLEVFWLFLFLDTIKLPFLTHHFCSLGGCEKTV